MRRSLNAKRNIFAGLFNKVIVLILPFVVRTIIIKTLGADYLGLSSLFSSILQVLNLTELGFSSAVVFSLYKPLAENDNDLVCALMSYYRRVYTIIGIVIIVGGVIVSPFLPKLIKGSWPDNINIYLLFYIYLGNTAISYLLFSYKTALLIASQRNDIDLNITTWTVLAQYAVQIIVLFSTHNFYIYALVLLVFTIFGNLLRAYITDKKFPQFKPHGTLRKDRIHDINQRVAGAFVQRLCATTRNSLDSIFLSAFLGLTTISIYGNYYLIMSSIHGILWVIVTAIMAGIGDSIASESIQKNYNDLRKFSFMYTWISGFCTVCLICLFQPFMELWVGPELMFPFSTVIMFCVYFYSLTMGDIRSAYTTGAGLWWEGRYRSVAETICNVALNWILGYFFGVNGIILATIISIVFINFIWGTQIVFKYYFKAMSIKAYYKDQCYYLIVTVITCIFSFFVCSYISTDIFPVFYVVIIRLFISALLPNIIFFLVYRKNRYFKESISLIKQIIPIRKKISN